MGGCASDLDERTEPRIKASAHRVGLPQPARIGTISVDVHKRIVRPMWLPDAQRKLSSFCPSQKCSQGIRVILIKRSMLRLSKMRGCTLVSRVSTS